MKKVKRTPAQNNAIWGLLSKLSLGAEDRKGLLRQLCNEVSGQEHSSQLTQAQAQEVIRRLQGRAPSQSGAPPPTKAQAEDATASEPMLTPAQQETLAHVFRQAGMTTLAQQRTFCQRQIKRPWCQTNQDFNAVYQGLKAIVLRDLDPTDFQRRVDALVNHPALDAWQLSWAADVSRQCREAAERGRLDRVPTTNRLETLIAAELASQAGAA